MSSLRKLERDRTLADLAAVDALLDQLTDDDIMMRFGLESRRGELAEFINTFEDEEDSTASAALFFGGRPVAGSRGIESNFGGSAVTKFQDLVAKLMAHEAGNLPQRGMVPNRSAATLHITNVVRGSFGFLLEEVAPQGQILDTALKAAVNDATQLLDAFGEPDEEKFRTAVEAVDDRVLSTARDFFDLMRQGGATFRLVAGNADRSFGLDAVERAAERATSTSVEQIEESIAGRLTGVLPESRQFEFKTIGQRGTIRGRIDKSFSTVDLTTLNRSWVNIDATAKMLVKRVLRSGQTVREGFALLNLDTRSAAQDDGSSDLSSAT